MGFGDCSTLAGKSLLKMVLALLLRWARARQGRPFPLKGTWPLIFLTRLGVGAAKLIVAATVAMAASRILIWLWR